jgi:hydrogenase nickel incorporation protein HypA/HybF
MHELAIADAVVGIVSRHAGGRRVTAVEVQVGHLRQVVPDALAFAFGLVAEGTSAEGAELRLEEVPAATRCRACAAETEQAGWPMRCPACGSFDVEVIRGEELLVTCVEVEEDLAVSTSMGGSGP